LRDRRHLVAQVQPVEKMAGPATAKMSVINQIGGQNK
jgi:hypothetical protein